MAEQLIFKFVKFDLYCPECDNKDIPGDQEPCNECLTNPVNAFSHKPVNYKGTYLAPQPGVSEEPVILK